MRSSSTAKRSPAEARAVRDLDAIKKFIAPLAPPVFVSVLLSARTRDAVTEKAAARLFAAAGTPQKMARLPRAEVERLIYPVGFYRTKAEHILKLCAALKRGGKFPATLEGLLELPGVGRKSANLVLALAFKRAAIAVDTHVFRIARRLGWAEGRAPAEVESELQRLFPRRRWAQVNQVLVGFGQTVCRPIGPKCPICVLKKTCPSAVL
jgi:endonuclease III